MAEHQSTQLLVDTPVVRVFDVVCKAPRSGYGALDYNSVALLALPRRGAFMLERRGEVSVVDPATAVVLASEDEYRISHPTDEGDEGTVLIIPPEHLEEVAGGTRGRLGRLRPRDHLAVCFLTRLLRDGSTGDLEAQDAVFLLLARLSPAFRQVDDARSLGPAQRLRVEQTRALLASSPATRWDLDTLGRSLLCSPFHLARQFRAATGETVSRYLLRLRLALAIELLGDGECDIGRVAIESGFSHHSHFTARFRSTFGVTPSAARRLLTKRRLDEARELVSPARRGVAGG
jgi:AraC family transcriptional regulator